MLAQIFNIQFNRLGVHDSLSYAVLHFSYICIFFQSMPRTVWLLRHLTSSNPKCKVPVLKFCFSQLLSHISFRRLHLTRYFLVESPCLCTVNVKSREDATFVAVCAYPRVFWVCFRSSRYDAPKNRTHANTLVLARRGIRNKKKEVIITFAQRHQPRCVRLSLA